MSEVTPEVEAHEIEPQPEAGFSLNWQMVDGYNATVQVTMRTGNLSDWPSVLTQRKDFMENATKNGWGIPGKPTAQAPAAAVAQASTPATPAAKPAEAAPVARANGKEIVTLMAARMEVEPKPEGKVQLRFYEAGHKFPDLYANGTVENMLKLLAPTGQWTEEHLATAASYDFVHPVRYTLGKPNSKGNPYKDIVNLG